MKKKGARIGALIAALALAHVCGCGTLLYQEDIEKIKLEQQASLSGPGPNTVAGETLRSYFYQRSAMIMPASNVSRDGSETFVMDRWGWAAALTEDGYYLTSGHVVAQGPPVLMGGRYGLTFVEGRVVRMFPDRDLALLKFFHRPTRFFQTWGEVPEMGDPVFTAGTYGPEPFAARGAVTDVEKISDKSQSWGISCTIPGMTGMSGAPLANVNGDLLGVIRGSSVSRFTGKVLATEVTMLQAAVIRRAIEADRTDNQELKDTRID